MQINDTNPIIYYCSQGRYGGGHCQEGMVGIINPASATALQAYAEAAAKVVEATSPSAGPFGGTFAPSYECGGGGSGPSTMPAGPGGPATPTSPLTPATVTGAASSVNKASWGGGVLAGVLAVLMA